MWSSNRHVRERAHENVKTNMKMINFMSTNWKFAALLKIYVRCLYNGHKKHPKILEDEPKYIDASKFTSFTVNAPHVQASILEFIGILRSKEDGYAHQGEAPTLEIEHLDEGEEPPSQASLPRTYDAAPGEQTASQAPAESWLHPYSVIPITPESGIQHQPGAAQHVPHDSSTTPLPGHPDQLPQESQNLDIFQPLLDPEMLDFFPDGELPDFSAFDMSPLNLDHFELEGWNDHSISDGAVPWGGNITS
ncbi:hypothetical protein LTR44_006042 [Exophiala sp. CCFEE 6388]|nr:hypothetical protein LTR44_006042 [Eurotiomycetes sp. CCFEE 6388]